MNCMTVLRCPVQINYNSIPASVRLNLLGLLIRWPIKFEIFRKGVVKLMTLAFHLRYSASPGCTMNEVSPKYWKEYFLIICWKDFLLQRKNKSSLNNNWLSVIFCLSFYTLHSTLGLNSGTLNPVLFKILWLCMEQFTSTDQLKLNGFDQIQIVRIVCCSLNHVRTVNSLLLLAPPDCDKVINYEFLPGKYINHSISYIEHGDIAPEIRHSRHVKLKIFLSFHFLSAVTMSNATHVSSSSYTWWFLYLPTVSLNDWAHAFKSYQLKSRFNHCSNKRSGAG